MKFTQLTQTQIFEKTIFLLALLAPSFPLPAVPFVWTGGKMALTPSHVQAFSDPSGQLTFDEVRSQKFQSVNSLNYSMSTAVQWVRFSVRSDTDEQMFLRLAHPLLDELNFFITTADGMERIQAGRSLPVSAWPLATADYIAPMTLKRKETAVIYIRMQSGNSRAC